NQASCQRSKSVTSSSGAETSASPPSLSQTALGIGVLCPSGSSASGRPPSRGSAAPDSPPQASIPMSTQACFRMPGRYPAPQPITTSGQSPLALPEVDLLDAHQAYAVRERHGSPEGLVHEGEAALAGNAQGIAQGQARRAGRGEHAARTVGVHAFDARATPPH